MEKTNSHKCLSGINLSHTILLAFLFFLTPSMRTREVFVDFSPRVDESLLMTIFSRLKHGSCVNDDTPIFGRGGGNGGEGGRKGG